jgi:aminoglycoside phosphotransferase (APT) family kinase protein
MGANPTPAAELDVSEAIVRHLLIEQHPDLAALPLRLVASGWDNVIFRLGDDMAVRLPRRELSAGLITNEQRWLPTIAPNLPLPVPTPLRVGGPSDRYPWSWSVLAWLKGISAATLEPDEIDHERVAQQLGEFLAALHVPAPADAPINPYRGIALTKRTDHLLAGLAILGDAVDAASVLRVFERARQVRPWTGPPVWLHGDMHPGNVLMSDRQLSAVIDFGDICCGDPASDVAIAWMMFPSHARIAFRRAGRFDDDTWNRARGWAVALGVAIAAHSSDNPTMRAVAVTAIQQALTDEG